IPELTSTPIDAAGGMAVSADGDLILSFSPGALFVRTEITIRTQRMAIQDLIAPVYEIGPSDLPVGRPASLRFHVRRAAAEPRLAEVGADAVAHQLESHFDVAAVEVQASIDHLARYSLIETTPQLVDAGPPDTGADTGPQYSGGGLCPET